MIKSRNLKFKYTSFNPEDNSKTEFQALNGINIDIHAGEFIAILGHNGSGKSTLAKHMNAIFVPSEGDLFVDSLNTKDENNIWDIRQKSGMVFQNPDNQIIATIVEEDIAFGPENLGIPKDEIKKRIDYALNSVEMSDYRKAVPSFLSGGQKQRIAIAGIIAMKPKYIILDEPTAMLDPIGRRDVINTIEKLNKEEGITIVLITHFMEEAIRADRVIVMDKGQVVLDDIPKKVFSQVEYLKNLGLDVPQVTELSYNLNKLGINISTDIISIDEMVEAICQLK